MHRLDKRKNDQMREVSIIPDFNKHAEGSALSNLEILMLFVMQV